MSQLEQHPEDAKLNVDEQVFRTVKSARHQLDQNKEVVRVRIIGLIVSRWKRGRAAGYWIEDVTGRACIVVPDKSVVRFENVVVGDRLIVQGTTHVSGKGDTIVDPESVERVATSLTTTTFATALAERQLPTHISVSYFLSRLRRVIVDFAESRGYREFEPFYLSTPGASSSRDPLLVNFQGWGGDLVLAASPAPQLLEVLLSTGEDRVFCVARSFTFAYRDGFTSAEKLTMFARRLGDDLDSAVQFARDAVQALFDDGDLAPPDTSWPRQVEWHTSLIQDFSMHEVDTPAIEILETERDARMTSVFRLVVPPGIAVAEGHVATFSGDLRVSATSVHLERFISWLSDQRLNELRNLGVASQSKSLR